MAYHRPTRLDPPVDLRRDHVLGRPEAELSLVEYGNYARDWLAERFRIAVKPEEDSSRHLAGVGALAGIGFTMSLFIATEAFPNPADFAAAKIAIFIASILAGLVGAAILWPKSGPAASEV